MKNRIIIFGFILLILLTSVIYFYLSALPPDNQNPVTDVKAGHQNNVSQGRLSWCGINWRVVSQVENNTWVDDQGRLHMRLQKIGDKWYCTTLESPYKVKYGKFIWNISSPSLNLERNTSIGMFTYADDNHEIDIEINQWPGRNEHLWFTNQPGSIEDYPTNTYYSVYSDSPYLNSTNITYIIDWEPTYINYSVISCEGLMISNWNYTNESGIPHMESTICQYFGILANITPQSEQNKEIVFNSFQYIDNKQLLNYKSVEDTDPEKETKLYKEIITKFKGLNEQIEKFQSKINYRRRIQIGEENVLNGTLEQIYKKFFPKILFFSCNF